MRPQHADVGIFTVTPTAPTQSLSDEDVVRRVTAGEKPLFEVIMRRYNQRLFRTVRATVPDDLEAERIMEEAYLRAFERLPEFEGSTRFSTWLMGIAVQEVLARKRLNGHRTVVARPGGGILEQAVEAIPETLRIVFVLRDVDGLATDETADCLGLSHVNVRVRLHRARTHLKTRFEGQVGSDMRQLHPLAGERSDRVIASVMSRLRERPEA